MHLSPCPQDPKPKNSRASRGLTFGSQHLWITHHRESDTLFWPLRVYMHTRGIACTFICTFKKKDGVGSRGNRVPISAAIAVSKDVVRISSLEPPRVPGSRKVIVIPSAMRKLELGT